MDGARKRTREKERKRERERESHTIIFKETSTHIHFKASIYIKWCLIHVERLKIKQRKKQQKLELERRKEDASADRSGRPSSDGRSTAPGYPPDYGMMLGWTLAPLDAPC